MRKCSLVLVLLLMGGLVGCQTTGSGIHTIPVSRDYSQLEKASVADAEAVVAEARRAGAQQFAPYEYYSAVAYLDLAQQMKKQRNAPAKNDYANLSRQMAQSALRKGPAEAAEAPPAVADWEAASNVFAGMKSEYEAIDAAKAEQVAPVLFAQVTASLSRLETAVLQQKALKSAAAAAAAASADMAALMAKDTDGDGVPDLEDAAPWAEEDFDGFEDEDGAPDLDNDQDGIPDVVDLAPDQPETKNNWMDHDGAPDTAPELTPVLFPSGSSTLSADAKGYLRGIAELLRAYPDLTVHLKGYTDDVPSPQYSLDLSRRRAQTVQEYLMEIGVPGKQLMVTFHGAADPVTPNATETGKAQNRRVELALE